MPTNNERKMSCGTDAPLTLSVIASSRWGPGGILLEARAGAHERRRRQSHVVIFQAFSDPVQISGNCFSSRVTSK